MELYNTPKKTKRKEKNPKSSDLRRVEIAIHGPSISRIRVLIDILRILVGLIGRWSAGEFVKN